MGCVSSKESEKGSYQKGSPKGNDLPPAQSSVHTPASPAVDAKAAEAENPRPNGGTPSFPSPPPICAWFMIGIGLCGVMSYCHVGECMGEDVHSVPFISFTPLPSLFPPMLGPMLCLVYDRDRDMWHDVVLSC